MQDNIPSPISAVNSPFAAFTFEARIPHILGQIKTDNKLSHQQESALDELVSAIKTGRVKAEKDDFLDHDWPYWSSFAQAYHGKRYTEIPFYPSEAYIYYQVMRIMGYPHTGADPFVKIKTDGLADNRDFLASFAETHANSRQVFNEAHFMVLLYNNLWANSADLSQLDADDVLRDASLRGKLVIDDTKTLFILVSNPKITSVDFIVDNAGAELLSDLFLIDYLLHTRQVEHITIHTKQYPIFVSDATDSDVVKHLKLLRDFKITALSQFADTIQSYLDEGKLHVQSHPFWNSPLHFDDIPDDLTRSFANDTILLFKGDANYRRLFGDREWATSTPIEQVLDYFKSPCVSIRTLKSEIVLGLTDSQVLALDEEDKNWRINGRYGLVMVAP